MDFFNQAGIELIQWVQGWGPWLGAPMRFFTFLGSEDFFLIVLPALYWSIDSALGIRVSFVLLADSAAIDLLKMAFAGPRPYWISDRFAALSAESSFGIPSGHAARAAGLFGTMAAYLRKGWAWALALPVILLIGVSRLYFGVHFVHDVLAGWLLGALVLWLVTAWWGRAAAWLKRQGLARQVALAFAASAVYVLAAWLIARARSGYALPEEWIPFILRAQSGLPAPLALSGVLTSAGLLFGLSTGLAWMESRGGYRASGPVLSRILRYIVGLMGVMVFWYGLGAVLPRGEEWLPLLLRFTRYSLVGGWVSGGAPWVFMRLGLAGRAPAVVQARA